MKLVSFERNERRRIGAVLADHVIDLTAVLADSLATGQPRDVALQTAETLIGGDMLRFLEGGSEALVAARRAIDCAGEHGIGLDGTPSLLAIADVTLLAPLPRPASIRDTISFEGHMRAFERRTGKRTPDLWYERPIYYKGNPASVIGTGTDVIWPAYADKLDYELEFGIIIGKPGRDIKIEDAASHIAGYLIFNDFSARDIIPGEVSVNLGPSKGKDFDTGNAMGPWLVTPDEIDPQNLRMEARINGETWSTGNSGDMYWSFAEMIVFISQSETLHPGDFIGSGTIENGCGDEMDRWLQSGDIVELEVEGLGLLKNRILRR